MRFLNEFNTLLSSVNSAKLEDLAIDWLLALLVSFVLSHVVKYHQNTMDEADYN